MIVILHQYVLCTEQYCFQRKYLYYTIEFEKGTIRYTAMKRIAIVLAAVHAVSSESVCDAVKGCEHGWSVSAKPTFEQLYRDLHGRDYDENDNVILNFTNPYDVNPVFKDYKHSNLVPDLFMEVLMNYEPKRPRFIVEVGSLHGHSAFTMAGILDEMTYYDVPILCIDPWTGDTNMWLNTEKDETITWVKKKDGRMLSFDQFMVNARFAMERWGMSPKHVIPFHATSTIGARWLRAKGYKPDIIFLDSAHEQGETLMEIEMYYELLGDGGIIIGDDYDWAGVKHDVDLFVARNHATPGINHVMFSRPNRGTKLFWTIRKPKTTNEDVDW